MKGHCWYQKNFKASTIIDFGNELDPFDKKKQEQWGICNNIVISWLHASMSDSIKKSILYLVTARDIWKQLEKRFTVSNGPAKYRLNKALYYTNKER
ncbi:Retrovirus-related Pol polyprotein from transposon TNT 1-94 [Bienertia sinuspersici]